MARQERKWHPEFKKYMHIIVDHPNYNGMPEPYKSDGSIRWVVTGNSQIGKAREHWWDTKRKELGIDKKPGWKALVARKIHPIGEKPCQICGRILSLDYIYPNKGCPYHKNVLEPCSREKCSYFQERMSCGHLGPGSMSDAPDRFDGFHSYNRCCRSKEDTGRHAENLMKYGEDRRVYEFWVEGDWKTASWLMKEFNKHKISPDHIGPISLGFCHRPKFRPSTKRENIAKGNRMTYEDVQSMLLDEGKGEKVVSWHSSFIWDKLKHHVKNDADAEKLSKLMRENLNKILHIFSAIHLAGYGNFLASTFLHPEYALYQPTFVNFDPKTGKCSDIITKRVNRVEHLRNAKRYIRKSLQAIEKYKEKDNRRVSAELGMNINILLKATKEALYKKNSKRAKKLLEKIFQEMAYKALTEYLRT